MGRSRATSAQARGGRARTPRRGSRQSAQSPLRFARQTLVICNRSFMVSLAGVRLRQGEAGLLGRKGSCGVLAVLGALVAFHAAPAFAGSGPTIPVPLLGTAPTIDGVQGTLEWNGASTTAVPFPGGLNGTLYVGRDANNLYVAL